MTKSKYQTIKPKWEHILVDVTVYEIMAEINNYLSSQKIFAYSVKDK